jgi:hypothetical protein
MQSEECFPKSTLLSLIWIIRNHRRCLSSGSWCGGGGAGERKGEREKEGVRKGEKGRGMAGRKAEREKKDFY